LGKSPNVKKTSCSSHANKIKIAALCVLFKRALVSSIKAGKKKYDFPFWEGLKRIRQLSDGEVKGAWGGGKNAGFTLIEG